MPNRMMSGSFCVSEQVAALDWFEEACFTRLILTADDYGRTDGRPAVLAARMFPLHRSVTDGDVANAMDRLCELGLVERYEVNGRPYLALTGWERHQKLRYRRAEAPPPENANIPRTREFAYEAEDEAEEKEKERDTHSAPACGGSTDNGRALTAGAGAPPTPPMDGALALQMDFPTEEPVARDSFLRSRAERVVALPFAQAQGFGTGFVPPGVAEVRAYIDKSGYDVDPQRFVDFYESKGWMIGTSPMRSWQAALNIWQTNLKAEQAAEARIASREGRALRVAGGGTGNGVGNSTGGAFGGRPAGRDTRGKGHGAAAQRANPFAREEE